MADAIQVRMGGYGPASTSFGLMNGALGALLKGRIDREALALL